MRERDRVNYWLPVFVLLLQLAVAKPFDLDQQVDITDHRSKHEALGEWRGKGRKV